MKLSRQDVDQLIKNFKTSPNEDVYNQIKIWYQQNQDYQDVDYLTCIYLFLTGANIKHRYTPLKHSEHVDQIRIIRELVDSSDSIQRMQRKTYLEYGTKSI